MTTASTPADNVTFVWDFGQWEVTKSLNGFDDVITAVHWGVYATDGTYKTGRSFGSFPLPEPTEGSASFVPKSDLITMGKTDPDALKAKLIAWAEASDKLGWPGLQQTLRDQLKALQPAAFLLKTFESPFPPGSAA